MRGNLFKSNLEILKRSSPAKMSKRFLSCVIDVLLVIFVTIAIFSGVYSITKNTSSYKNATDVVNAEIEYYENLTEQCHVVEYENGERLSNNIVAYKNAIKAVYQAYITYDYDSFNFESIFVDEKYSKEEVGKIISEMDNIGYFYTEYLPKNDKNGLLVNMKGVSPNVYLRNIYKANFGTEYSDFFVEDDAVVPLLKEDAANFLFCYLFGSESSSIKETAEKYYNNFSTYYMNMLDEAEKTIILSEGYSPRYMIYKEAYCNQARYSNISLIVSLFLGSMLVLLLPKFLFKNEKTVGYKLLGLGVITMDGKENPWYIVLVKTMIESTGYILCSIILYLFAPFNGVYDAMFLPFTVNSNISFGTIILIIGIIGALVNMVGLFTHYHQNLTNIVFRDKVVDIHLIDQGDSDDKYEGRPY